MSLGAAVSLIEIDYGGPGGIVFPSLFTARAPQGGGGGGGGGRVHNYPGSLASLLPGYSHFPRRVLLARVYVRSTNRLLFSSFLGGEGGHLPRPPLVTASSPLDTIRVVRLRRGETGRICLVW